MFSIHIIVFFFFFNDTATTEIYTLSLHDALPISRLGLAVILVGQDRLLGHRVHRLGADQLLDIHRVRVGGVLRSEEHTSELQSHLNLVCRLLLEKKKKNNKYIVNIDM